MVFIRADATYFTSQVPTQNVFATLSSLAGAVASLIGVLAFVMVQLEDRFYVPDPEADQAELDVWTHPALGVLAACLFSPLPCCCCFDPRTCFRSRMSLH